MVENAYSYLLNRVFPPKGFPKFKLSADTTGIVSVSEGSHRHIEPEIINKSNLGSHF